MLINSLGMFPMERPSKPVNSVLRKYVRMLDDSNHAAVMAMMR